MFIIAQSNKLLAANFPNVDQREAPNIVQINHLTRLHATKHKTKQPLLTAIGTVALQVKSIQQGEKNRSMEISANKAAVRGMAVCAQMPSQQIQTFSTRHTNETRHPKPLT